MTDIIIVIIMLVIILLIARWLMPKWSDEKRDFIEKEENIISGIGFCISLIFILPILFGIIMALKIMTEVYGV